jgi:benzoyl-CoA reductase/2-hydroxyglutaryl-CoA dehydratase subunit BcrC/BadD/HgdB
MTAKAAKSMEVIQGRVKTFPERVRREKRGGRKIVGMTGRFVPEELVRASGAIPYLLCRGGDPEPVEASLPYMHRFLNPFVRAQLGYHLLGMDPVVPMLDLIVAQCDDCHASRLADLMEYLRLPAFRIGIPPDWQKELSVRYYAKGLARLKGRLEELTGRRVTEAGLRASIESLNRVRTVLQEIGDLRKKENPPIGGLDFLRLNHASFYEEPDLFAAEAASLLEALEEGPGLFAPDAPRVLLAGRVVAVGDYAVPRLIEESGGVIVAEVLDEGVRHCAWKVDEGGDPMDALVETYFLRRLPPSIFQPSWGIRVRHLKESVLGNRVDGIVWYQLAFDEVYDMEYAAVARAMSEMQVPILKVESSYEYARESTGPLATRLESFVESLRAKRRVGP